MERICRGRVIAKMMMVITVNVIILSVSLVVDGGGVQYLSPNSQILSSSSLAFNSCEDNFKAIHYISKPINSIGSRIVHKGKEIIGLRRTKSTTPDIPPDESAERERSEVANETELVGVTYGFNLVKANSKYNLSMKEYAVAEVRKINSKRVVGVFGIYGGFYRNRIPIYLQSHLLENIITQPTFWFNTVDATREAYLMTNTRVMKPSSFMEASSAVTATLLMNNEGSSGSNYKLVVANVGSSRAIICCDNGEARQLSVDHIPENEMERKAVENRGAKVKLGPKNELRIAGLFPLTRAFGCSVFRKKISCEPHVVVEIINRQTEFLVLANRPLWRVMSNQQVVDSIRHINNARQAAQLLTQQTLNMPGYYDIDISCLVVRFDHK